MSHINVYQSLYYQGYTVSENGVWVDGIYDKTETAHAACKYTDAELQQISAVWEHDGEDRPATMDDLARIVRDAVNSPA